MNLLTTKSSLLTIKEAAKVLKVNEKTLRRWEAKGYINPIRTAGMHRRYSLDHLKTAKRNQKKQTIISSTANINLEPNIFKPVVEEKTEQFQPKVDIKSHKHFSFSKIFASYLVLAMLSTGGLTVLKLKSTIEKQNSEVEIVNNAQYQNSQNVLAATSFQNAEFTVNIPTILNSSLTIGNDTITDITGNGLSIVNGALTAEESPLGNSITSNEITDGTISEVDLLSSNTPTNSQYLTFNSSTGGFTWITPTTPTDEVGTNFFTDNGDLTYLTSTTDDFAIGGTSTSAPFYIDAGTGTISLNKSSAGKWIQFNDGTDEWGLYNYAGSPEGNITANTGTLAMDTLNGTLYVKTDDSDSTGWVNLATGASSPWDQSAGLVSLGTTTNNISVGGSTNLAKLAVDGDNDEIQLLVQANGTQTSDLVVFENSSGLDLFKLANNGAITLGSSLTSYTNTIQQSASQTANITYTLPIDDGASSNYVLTTDGNGVLSWQSVNGVGGMSGFTLSGDSGSNQTISDSNTLLISGGVNGIDTSTSATDTITLDIDTTEIGENTFGNNTDNSIVWTFDQSGTTDPTLAFGDGLITVGGDLSISGGNITSSVTFDSSVNVTGVLTANGRLDTASHTNNTGLNLPTYSGTPTAVTGTSEGDIVYDTLNDSLYIYDGGSFTAIGGGGYSGWTLDGDDADTESIASGNTAHINGGTNGIDTDVSSTDTITLNFDATEVGTVTFGSGSAITWTFDASGGTDPTISFSSDLVTINNGLTVSGATTTNGNLMANGLVTLGDGGDLVSISSSDWGISNTGDQTGIGSIALDGDITNTQSTPSLLFVDSTAVSDDYSLNVDAGSLTISNDTDGRNDVTISDTGNVTFGNSVNVNGSSLTLGSNGTDGALTLYSELGTTDYSVVLQPSNSQTQSTTYTFPISYAGGNNYVLTSDTSGVLSWQEVTSVGGAGDITAVGDVTTGAAFTASTGNDGNTLYFEGTTSDGNEIALTGADAGSDTIVTLPAIAGTLASLSGTQTFDGQKSFTNSSGITVGLDSTSNTKGLITLISDGSNDFSTIFQTGTQTQNVTYTLPLNDGTSDQALTTDGNGVLTWKDIAGVGGVGDITAVGNATSGEAFTSGTPGSSLYFANNGYIADNNGNELLKFTTTASAVNELTLANAAANGNVTLTITGSDTDIDLETILKGTGTAIFSSTTANADKLSIKPQSSTATNTFTGTITSLDLTGNRTYTLKDSDGTIAFTSDIPTSDNYQYFILDGDDADTEQIGSTQTLLVSGGTNGIDTDVSSTDTITLNFDATEVGTVTFGSGSAITWTFDASGGTDPTISFSSDLVTIGADLAISGGNVTTATTFDSTLTTTGTMTANGTFDANGVVTLGDGGDSVEISGSSLIFDIGGTDEVTLTSSALTPSTSDGNALGTGTLMWSDLFLADGAVINFNNGDIALTHSTDTLSFTGGDYNFDIIDGKSLNIDGDGSPTADILVLGASDTVATDQVDALSIALGAADGANLTNSAINISLTSTGTASGDLMRGIYLDLASVANAASTNKAIVIGNTTAWDTDIQLQNAETIDNVTDGTITLTAPNTALSGDLAINGGNITSAVTADSTLTITGTTTTNGTLTANGLVTLGDNGDTVAINSSDWDIDTTGAITGISLDANGSGNSITNIDFDNILASPAVDEATDINLGANQLSIDLDSTGDFSIRDVTTDIATFADSGAITFTPTAGTAFLTNLGVGSNVQITTTANPTTDLATISNSGFGTTTTGVDGLAISFVTGDGTNPTNNGLNLVLTSGGTASGDILNGINFGLTGTSGTERGINFSDNNFDTDINATTDLTIGIDGTNEVTLTSTNLTSSTAEGNSLGSATLEWEQLFVGDDNGISFGLDQDWTMGYDETTDDRLELVTSGTSGLLIQTANATGTSLNLTSNALTTGTGMLIDNSANTLTTGTLLQAQSTATSLTTASDAFLGYFDWTPATSTTASGDLFRINIGSNGNVTNVFNVTDAGSSLFRVSETQIESTLPHLFSATGDVNIAYDLIFTNQTASTIDSYGPLTLRSGENFESNNLTLTSYNSGNILLNTGSTAGKVGVGANITPLGLLTVDSTGTGTIGKAALTVIQDESQDIITASASATTRFTVNSAGNTFVTLRNTATSAVCHVTNGAGYDELTDCLTSVSADYAERYPVSTGITYGEIVMTGSENVTTTDGQTIKKLVKSNAPYQNNIIGITSDNWGDFTSAGDNVLPQDNPMPVALSGRVPVKISNSSEAINSGDFITSSSEEGKAMKATSAGKVIATALESWTPNSGKETIMVFVNNFYYTPVPENSVTREEIEELLLITEQNQQLLEQSQNWNTNTATTSGEFTDLISENLYVTGIAAFDSLSVTDSLTINNNLVIGNGNIDSLTTPLNIEGSGSQAINIMAGKISIDTQGNMVINGDLKVLGTLDANKVNVSNQIAGTGNIVAGTDEVILTNSNIKTDSLIFVTPTSPTKDAIYVKSKIDGQAVIGFETPLNPTTTDITFNWWIVGITN